MISSFYATLRNAADLSFPRVAKKRPRKYWIQEDTWLLIRQSQKQRLVCGSGSSLVSNERKFSVCALDVSALCKLEAVALRILERLQYAERCAIRRDRREQWKGAAASAQCAANRNDSLRWSLPVCVQAWCLQGQRPGGVTEISFAMLIKHAADGRNLLPSFFWW